MADGAEGADAALTARRLACAALDLLLFQYPRPPIGTRITLTYPKGAADKARLQRLVLRGLLYGV